MSEWGTALKNFPAYIFRYVAGFVYGALCDVTLTTLTLLGGAVGWITNDWRIGAATFLTGHFSIRVANSKGEATVVAGRYQAQALYRIAQLLTPPPPPTLDEHEASEEETPGT